MWLSDRRYHLDVAAHDGGTASQEILLRTAQLLGSMVGSGTLYGFAKCLAAKLRTSSAS
jgi:hypothetical protein